MRKLVFIAAVVMVALSCQTKEKKSTGSDPAEVVQAVRYEVVIEGMTCTGCEETISAGIEKLDGIVSVKADYTEGKATVEFAEGKTDTTAIKESITGSGYGVVAFKQLEIRENINQ